MRANLQEVTLQSKCHRSLGIADDIASFGNIHVENGFAIEAPGDGSGAEGCDEPCFTQVLVIALEAGGYVVYWLWSFDGE